MKRSLECVLALFFVFAVLFPACGSDDDDSGSASDDSAATSTTAGLPSTEAPDTTDGADALEGSLSVSAAASLRVAFDEIGHDFTEAHPDVDVTFNFDSSSTLVTQIQEGAPAEVFASADQANMTKLTDGSLIDGEPATFARNELVIVTKPGNPTGIAELADLADAGIISLCGEDVPCGKYAKEAFELAGVTVDESNVTRGQNVTATLTALTEGDAVAAVVYATDAIAAGDAVERVDIPDDVNVLASYPIGVLVGAGDSALAQAFMDYILSSDGQLVLEEHGFLPAA